MKDVSHHIAIPLLLLIAFAVTIPRVTPVSIVEIAAICDLIDAIPGVINLPYPWACNLASNHSCNFTGITCFYGMITEVNLNTLGLSGVIPSFITQFENLQYLNLAVNKLSGTIPSQLGGMNLTILNLYNNVFTGTVPSQLGRPSSPLTELILGSNLLDGTIPTQLGRLRYLENLDLDYNHLNGTIPSTLQYLTNLNYLSLCLNKLTGTIPSQIGSLIKLTGLLLNTNPLNGSIPTQFEALTKLQTLELSSTDLCGCFPSSWMEINVTVENCDVSGIPHQCNCGVSPVCVQTCSSTAKCPWDVPVPPPQMQSVIPSPSSAQPNSSSSGHESSTAPEALSPIPPFTVPEAAQVPCSSSADYSSYFNCVAGTWTTNDLYITDDEIFSGSYFHVTGNVYITGSLILSAATLNVDNEFLINKVGSFDVQDGSTVVVSGNFSLTADGTLKVSVQNNFKPIIIIEDAELEGFLQLSFANYTINGAASVGILYYKSAYGSFQNIQITNTPSCLVVSTPSSTSTALSTQVSGECAPEGAAVNNTGAIVGGVVGGVLGIILIIVIVVLILRSHKTAPDTATTVPDANYRNMDNVHDEPV